MPKVLIVDDIEDNVLLLLFNLEDDGYTVISASNGKECLEKAQEEMPDVILLDMMMPVMDGRETLVRLKSDPKLRNIPVIMISANDSGESIVEALDIGAHDYVSKPFIYPILAARIRSAIRLQESQEQLAKANKDLERLASLDSLTEIYNRRHFYTLVGAEFSKYKRNPRPLTMMMMDVDKFKSINDRFGHAAGDAALVKIAQICKDECRSSEIFARLGGEEFAFCCPETDLAGAEALAERLRTAIERAAIETERGPLQFTVSLGIARAREEDEEWDSILNRADKRLYRAKHSGRNCWVSDNNQDALQAASK